MAELKNVSTDELERELKARKVKKIMTPPEMLELPEWDGVKRTVESINADMIKRGYDDDDNKHWIYEAVIDTLYGKEGAPEYYAWVKKITSIDR